MSELVQRMRACEKEGKAVAEENPAHAATVRMGLAQLQERWNNLQELLREQGQRLDSAGEYFRMLERSEKFLKEANRSLLVWSRKVASLMNGEEAGALRSEIDRYLSEHRTTQSETLFKISSRSGQVFGSSSFTEQNFEQIQREQTETFEAILGLLVQIDQYSKRKSVDEEESRRKEHEASVRVAKAEAEAARRAARQTEEARRAAEAAAAIKVVTQVTCTQTQTETGAEEQGPRPVAPLFTQYLQDVVLLEGQACELKARVSGIPAPQITWFKDGVPVHNADYKASYSDSGRCLLLIEETFVEDSANWSVRASNPAGYAESHAKLTVKEAKPVAVEEEAPRVVVPLKDGHAAEGDFYEFRCKANQTPVASFQRR